MRKMYCPVCGAEIKSNKGWAAEFYDGYCNKCDMPIENVKENEEMEIFEVKIETTLLVSQEDIDDIMMCALEGGITYWCDSCKVVGEYLGEYASDQISRGGELKLYECEDDEWHTLTLEKFLNGVRLWYLNGGSECCTNMIIDTFKIDGMEADAIIQYALFGEIVYG